MQRGMSGICGGLETGDANLYDPVAAGLLLDDDVANILPAHVQVAVPKAATEAAAATEQCGVGSLANPGPLAGAVLAVVPEAADGGATVEVQVSQDIHSASVDASFPIGAIEIADTIKYDAFVRLLVDAIEKQNLP